MEEGEQLTVSATHPFKELPIPPTETQLAAMTGIVEAAKAIAAKTFSARVNIFAEDRAQLKLLEEKVKEYKDCEGPDYTLDTVLSNGVTIDTDETAYLFTRLNDLRDAGVPVTDVRMEYEEDENSVKLMYKMTLRQAFWLTVNRSWYTADHFNGDNNDWDMILQYVVETQKVGLLEDWSEEKKKLHKEYMGKLFDEYHKSRERNNPPVWQASWYKPLPP